STKPLQRLSCSWRERPAKPTIFGSVSRSASCWISKPAIRISCAGRSDSDMQRGPTLRNVLNRPLPSLLIFDCDGVLVDSELIDARIRGECFQAEGFAVTAEDLRNHPGISGAGLAEMIRERFG